MKWAILMLKHCSGLFWNINQSNLVTLFLAVKLVYEHRGLRKAQTLVAFGHSKGHWDWPAVWRPARFYHDELFPLWLCFVVSNRYHKWTFVKIHLFTWHLGIQRLLLSASPHRLYSEKMKREILWISNTDEVLLYKLVELFMNTVFDCVKSLLLF